MMVNSESDGSSIQRKQLACPIYVRVMKAVIYARTSTNEQSTDNQVPVLQDWAKRRDFEVIEVYQETESAWKSGHQKELARLLSDCRNGRCKFNVVFGMGFGPVV